MHPTADRSKSREYDCHRDGCDSGDAARIGTGRDRARVDSRRCAESYRAEADCECEVEEDVSVARAKFCITRTLYFSFPIRAFSNSSPFSHCISLLCSAAAQPRANPKRAMAASAVKSMLGLYSSLG